MKLLKSLIYMLPLVLMSFIPKQAEPLKWYEWNEGYEKAVKEGKIVLVDAYTDWCGWCKRMDKDTYSKEDVIKKINKHFVPIKFNPEELDKTYKIGSETYSAQQLYYMLTHGSPTGFPTVYYIFPKKMSITIDPGYKGPQDFLQALDTAVAASVK